MTVEVRDVIQIKQAGGRKLFAGCFAVVTEVRQWGVRALVIGPGDADTGRYEFPINLPFTDFEVIGKEWSPR